MKKMVFITICLAVTMAVVGRDRMYINDFSIKVGETKKVDLILQNDTVYCAFQTDLYLPQGLTVEPDGDDWVVDLTSRKNRNHVLSTNIQQDGALRIFVTSQAVQPFRGTDGAIATISLVASSSFGSGEVNLRNTMVVEETGVKHLLDDCAALVNGGDTPSLKKGDVNGDGNVNGSDVTALYNYLLDGAAAKGNPDMSGDGNVNGSDVTALYNILLN